jgi:hypothetical protein
MALSDCSHDVDAMLAITGGCSHLVNLYVCKLHVGYMWAKDKFNFNSKQSLQLVHLLGSVKEYQIVRDTGFRSIRLMSILYNVGA